MRIRQVYINTSQGTVFYDDYSHEWKGKTGNVDSIDMESLKKKVFAKAGVTNEIDFAKIMKKLKKIS